MVNFKLIAKKKTKKTVTELGLPVSWSSTRISKFHDSTDSEHMILIINFIKQESKIGYSYGLLHYGLLPV